MSKTLEVKKIDPMYQRALKSPVLAFQGFLEKWMLFLTYCNFIYFWDFRKSSANLSSWFSLLPRLLEGGYNFLDSKICPRGGLLLGGGHHLGDFAYYYLGNYIIYHPMSCSAGSEAAKQQPGPRAGSAPRGTGGTCPRAGRWVAGPGGQRRWGPRVGRWGRRPFRR